MKITHFLISTLIFFNTACKNGDNSEPLDPVDELPPATQIGAQTFGCVVDGEPFTPDAFGGNQLKAFYQMIDDKYSFSINGGQGGGPNLISISLGGIMIDNLEEGVYQLKEDVISNTFGGYIRGADFYTTKTGKPGGLKITNYDPEKFILSGTFEFTVLDSNGEEIKITDGRFDVKYTN